MTSLRANVGSSAGDSKSSNGAVTDPGRLEKIKKWVHSSVIPKDEPFFAKESNYEAIYNLHVKFKDIVTHGATTKYREDLTKRGQMVSSDPFDTVFLYEALLLSEDPEAIALYFKYAHKKGSPDYFTQRSIEPLESIGFIPYCVNRSASNSCYYSPLNVAILSGNVSGLLLMIKNGLRPDPVDALKWAVQSDQVEMLQALNDKCNCKYEGKNDLIKDLIFHAVSHGATHTLKFLLKQCNIIKYENYEWVTDYDALDKLFCDVIRNRLLAPSYSDTNVARALLHQGLRYLIGLGANLDNGKEIVDTEHANGIYRASIDFDRLFDEARDEQCIDLARLREEEEEDAAAAAKRMELAYYKNSQGSQKPQVSVVELDSGRNAGTSSSPLMADIFPASKSADGKATGAFTFSGPRGS